ncbi:hypothetical protein E4N62_46755 [Streptomyces sp. MNU76]|uniref:hypothetical protein n=1 Tax=Streptomyces sp. MNU76 TaxID=2560026 RepID=UPI001E526342|nr:hypothetical protein [Streptomyces sp. MNU76]MCC9712058.1 hypothetical protein [Streptomyces sp. MNU76]
MQLWYDRNRQPIDADTANRLLGDQGYVRIALTELTAPDGPHRTARISTVWRGIDIPSFGPQLFETMVFGGPEDQRQQRYDTEDEARAGHDSIVAETLALIPGAKQAPSP